MSNENTFTSPRFRIIAGVLGAAFFLSARIFAAGNTTSSSGASKPATASPAGGTTTAPKLIFTPVLTLDVAQNTVDGQAPVPKTNAKKAAAAAAADTQTVTSKPKSASTSSKPGSIAAYKDIILEITVRNKSENFAGNLTVEYTVWNQTKSSGGTDGPSTSITTITGNEAIDLIDPGKTAVVESKHISHNNTMSTTGPKKISGGRGATVSGNTTSSTQVILGWLVDVKFQDAVVVKKESEVNIAKKMDDAIAKIAQ